MNISTPHPARSALLSALLVGCTLSVALPVQATEQAQQRRQARDLRQDVRQNPANRSGIAARRSSWVTPTVARNTATTSKRHATWLAISNIDSRAGARLTHLP